MSRHAQSDSQSIALLKKTFSNYYRKAQLELPSDMDRREFAFQYLASNTYHRHLSFKDEKSLRSHLISKSPAHSFYSSAQFLLPQVPSMEEKKWLGSDLIFDIDADDLPGCQTRERTLVCPRCGYSFRGAGSPSCPRCGEKELIDADTVDEECMKKALVNLANLVDVLKTDFGLPAKSAYFSGGRGYHLHITCDNKCRSMTSEERRELVDYLKGTGLDIDKLLYLGGQTRGKKNTIVPQPSEPGWRGRIGSVIARKHGRLPPLTTIGTLETMLEGPIEWDLYINEAAIHLDEKVTIDIHRLVRIPGSINGKTGMPVKRIDPDKPAEESIPRCEWSPFNSLEMLVKLKNDLPQIRVFDRIIKGRSGQILKLSGCESVYLMLKGLAVPAPMGRA